MSATFPPRKGEDQRAAAAAQALQTTQSSRRAGQPVEPENARAGGKSAAKHAADWAARRERSNRLALRFMAWVAVTLGRPAARLLLPPIALYYLLFAPATAHHSARYLGRALGRPATVFDRFRHIHAFASCVLDRVYFARGQMQLFDLQVQGGEHVDAALATGRGGVMLGAHLGSFEALHAVGATRPGMHVAMVMYPDNAQMIHGVLQALAPGFHLDVITIGTPGSTLAIRDWLDGGGLVGMLGDRHLGPDTSRGASLVEVPFLGVPALFTDGPLRLAALLRRRVVFMAGLYRGGHRYETSFETLADFSQPPADAAAREAQIRAALLAYVSRLEVLVRRSPYNWFNFYDYWCEDSPR